MGKYYILILSDPFSDLLFVLLNGKNGKNGIRNGQKRHGQWALNSRERCTYRIKIDIANGSLL